MLYEDDGLKILPGLARESMDLIFADPPFNLGKPYGGKQDSDQRADYYEWCRDWIAACFQVLKPTGSMFLMTISEHVGQMHISMAQHGIFRNQIIWFNSSMPVRDRFCLGYQPILWFSKSEAYTFNYGVEKRPSQAALPWGRENRAGSLKDIWDDIPFVSAGCMASKEAILAPGTKRKLHPAQMPVRLAERIIRYCSNPGDLVLDPFSGIGTTGVACMKSQRHFVGIEKENLDCQATRERWDALRKEI